MDAKLVIIQQFIVNEAQFSVIICAYGAFVKVNFVFCSLITFNLPCSLKVFSLAVKYQSNFVFRSLIRTFNRLLPLEGTLARCEILK